VSTLNLSENLLDADLAARPVLMDSVGSHPQTIVEVFEQLFQQIDSASPYRVYLYDLRTQQTVYANTAIAQLLGYPANTANEADPAPEDDELAQFIHPDDLNSVADDYQRLTALPVGIVLSLTYRMKHADGHWCWLRSHETPFLVAPQGYSLQILGIVQVLPVSLSLPMAELAHPFTPLAASLGTM
jgi:PAS domain-containing protein